MTRSWTCWTWFDLARTYAFVLRDREDGAPVGIADVVSGRHRTNTAAIPVVAVAGQRELGGRAPYRNVVTHGFTLDEKGMKMFKPLRQQ